MIRDSGSSSSGGGAWRPLARWGWSWPACRSSAGHEDQLRVDREVGEAAAVGEEGLPRVAVPHVLAGRVLDRLARQRVLQLGGEDRDPVEAEDQVEALLGLLAVMELAHDGEKVGRVQAPRLLVQPAHGPGVRQPEGAARVLDPVPENVERPATPNLGGQAVEEALLHLAPVVLLEPRPGLRLGGQDEVEGVAGDEAQAAVVLLGLPPVVATRRVLGRRRLFSDDPGLFGHLDRALQQRALDGRFEGPLADVHHWRPVVVIPAPCPGRGARGSGRTRKPDDPISPAPGDLAHDAELLQPLQRLGDRRRAQLRRRAEPPDRGERPALQLVVNPERGAGAAPQAADALPVLPELLSQRAGCPHGALGRRPRALREEGEPSLPVALSAHFVEEVVVLLAVRLEVQAQVDTLDLGGEHRLLPDVGVEEQRGLREEHRDAVEPSQVDEGPVERLPEFRVRGERRGGRQGERDERSHPLPAGHRRGHGQGLSGRPSPHRPTAWERILASGY
jgi:hypothetical protein